jgi:hypothetical protein
MWILVSFAIVALVIFLVMILLKIEPIISMVISVLAGLIIAYFMNHLTITYSEDKYKNRNKDDKNDKDKNSTTLSTNSNIATNVPTTHIQSSDSNTANLSNSNSFGFFQSGK